VFAGPLFRTPWVALVAAALLALAAGPRVAFAQPRADGAADELRVSVASGPALPLGKAAERWVAFLGEGSEPLAARLHAGASLAGRDAAREFVALKDGHADLAVASALQWSLQLPALAVFSLPWIAPEDRELAAMTGDPALVEALASRLDAAGVVLVAIAPLGYREIATTSRPIRAPEDLQGLRIRAAPAPLLHDTLLALGCLPQAMSFRDALTAFAQGTLDGQEGAPSALAAARAGAGGLRHLTDWGAIADAIVFAVRKPVWDTWSEARREAVRSAARRAIEEAAPLERDAAAVRQLSRNGVALVRITPAGHEAFRTAVEPVLQRWREAVGADIVERAERAIAAAGEAGPTPR
jgi:TRAP-type C4-dicarboxylate transport system substrate-binding protein